MKMPVPSEGGKFERCPEGNHVAVCYEVIDIGTVETTYLGETKRQRKIWVGWEIPNETMEDGRPHVIGKRYTLSSYEKATLRKDLESWRGKKFNDKDFGPEGNFDIKQLLGKGCLLNVVYSEKEGKTYANIETVAALPKGTATPALTNNTIYLSLDKDEFKPEVFEALSERMQNIIRESPEFHHVESLLMLSQSGAPAAGPDDDSEIPF
jgi:hypothetical protein